MQQVQPSAPPASQGTAPGAQFYRHGPGQTEFVTQGLPPGYALARVPGQGDVPLPLPGYMPKAEVTKTDGAIIYSDPRTGREINRIGIPSTARTTTVETPDGTQLYRGGQPVSAPIPFSGRKEQNEAYTTDKGQMQSVVATAQAAQNNMPRLNEMADLAQQLQTGPTSDVRAKAQAYLETIGVAPERAASLTGISSASAAQEFTKLAITSAGAASKADVGANNGIESVRLYQSANPGLALMPDANKRITNMMRVAAQGTQDYAQAALQHFGANESQFLGGKQYAP